MERQRPEPAIGRPKGYSRIELFGELHEIRVNLRLIMEALEIKDKRYKTRKAPRPLAEVFAEKAQKDD